MDYFLRHPNMTMISRLLFGPFRPSIEAMRPVLYRIAYQAAEIPPNRTTSAAPQKLN